MSLVDSFSHLSLVRLGHFMESVFKQQPLSEKSRFLWIRLGHDPLPLTRPLTIVAHSKELALAHSPNEWNATRQAAFAREFQGLIDAEKGKENAPLDTLINMC